MTGLQSPEGTGPGDVRGSPRPVAALLGLSVAILLAAFADVRAQTPPGTRIVNVARCDYVRTDPGAAGVRESVPSNPVTTTVVAEDCFRDATVRLEVDPQGPAAPGDVLEFVVAVDNPLEFALPDVEIELTLGPEADRPVELRAEVPGAATGDPPVVVVKWDPVRHSAVWRVERIEGRTSARFRARVPISRRIRGEQVLTARATVRSDVCLDELRGDPLDVAVVGPLLRVAKRADRATVVPGDAVLYGVEVAHDSSGPGLDAVEVVDVLPPGLRYVAGSARVDDADVPDPAIEPDGRTVRFDIGALAPGEVRSLRYAARVAPGARLGPAANRAVAVGRTAGGIEIDSPPSTATVTVGAGPFHVEGALAGRVFIDRDGDRLPGDDDPGVPGVLVFLEDGRGAVTDVHGRWHVENVRPGTHAVRIDPGTLPAGLAAADATAEAPGVRGSRFVELRATTLAVVDLPVGPDDAAACRIEVDDRVAAVPAASLLSSEDAPGPNASVHLERAARTLASAGTPLHAAVRCEAPRAEGSAELTKILAEHLAALAPGRDVARVEGLHAPDVVLPHLGSPPDDGTDDPLATVIRTVPAETAILSPADGHRIVGGATAVEVVFPSDHRPDLRVNGTAVAEDRIGTRSTLPSRGLTAARYVGVRLRAGRNRLTFRAVPPGADTVPEAFVERWIVAPGEAAEVRLEPRDGTWIADGVTPGVLVVSEVDGSGVRTTGKPVVTLRVEGATVLTPDLDPLEPGFQVRLSDGSAEVRFAPVNTPGRVLVFATDGEMETDLEIPVAPGASRWRVLGLAEGRAAGDGGVEGDGGAGPTLDDPITDSGGRVAVYARGPVGDGLQLTARLDTDRDRDRERMNDQIEPERFWPVYGDDALAIEEATSQGQLYARLDGRLGFARWGDFSSGFTDTELLRYDRRMYGLSGRVGGRRVAFEGFASDSDQGLLRDVFEPDGTSGPYLLRVRPIVARSEAVFVEVRERFRTEVVVSRRMLLRDIDYDLDPATGALLLRAPLNPFDGNLDPLRIVVLYEARSGPDRVTAGGRVSFGLGERVRLAASGVREERDGDDLGLYGIDLDWRPLPGTRVVAEVATSDGGSSDDVAYRVEVDSRTRPDLVWDVSWRDLPAGFENPSLLASPELGSRRGGGRVTWKPRDDIRVRGQATYQSDDRFDLERTTATVDTEKDLGPLTVLGGLTHARSDGETTGVGTSTLLRAGVRGRWATRWTVEATREQPLDGGEAVGFPGRTRVGVGYQIREGLRAFALQEWEDDDETGRDRTSLGVEGRIGERSSASHRWFVEPSGDGRAIRSATAVETAIPLREGHRLNLIASRVWTVSGDEAQDATVLGGGYEIRGGRSLFTSRYEVRLGAVERRHLASASGALRLGRAWSLLVRERLFVTEPETTGVESGRRVEGRLGLAWRPIGGRLQGLIRVDHADGWGGVGSPSGVVPGAPTEPSGAIVDTAAPLAPGIGWGPGRVATAFDRSSWTLSLAGGARLTERQRLALTWVGRRVAGDPGDGIDAALTHLTSLHWSIRAAERWTFGTSVRRFAQDASAHDTLGYGAEVGFAALRDLWVVAGWNASATRDDVFDDLDASRDGPFVSVRFRFDEGTLADLLR